MRAPLDNVVVLDFNTYRELIDDQRLLRILQTRGVNLWDGYAAACEEFVEYIKHLEEAPPLVDVK